MDSESSKKKILYVITKGTWGGAQRYVYDLAVSLPGEQFTLGVAYGQRGQLAEKLEHANIETFNISALARDISFAADAKSISELRRLFKRLRPDIVHLNSSKAGGTGALAARLAGVPHILFTVHGWPFLEKRNTAARAVIWAASWLTALLAHTVIVISEYDLRIARRMPGVGKKTVRIYNGIGPMAFGSGDVIRRAFPRGVHITGTIGELTKNKNHIALLEEAHRMPDMYVAIVGEGESRPMLEQKIKEWELEERVKLFGFLPADEVLKGFDTFALPSLKEGLPYVLLEAKMAGLPIVANRVGGVGEILDAHDMSEFALASMVEKTIALYQPCLPVRQATGQGGRTHR